MKNRPFYGYISEILTNPARNKIKHLILFWSISPQNRKNRTVFGSILVYFSENLKKCTIQGSWQILT